MIIYIFALTAPLFAAIGHILLKRSSIIIEEKMRNRKRFEAVLSSFFFIVSAIIGIISMKYLEFSVFYSLTALSYVFVGLLAYLVLGEPYDKEKIFGSLITVVGVLIYNL